jgi:hypothetical protein
VEGTYLVSRVRAGAPVAAASELVERLGVIALPDAAIGPIKARARGHSAGQLLVRLPAVQLAGEDHLVGLDRRRADGLGRY